MSILFLSKNAEIVLTGKRAVIRALLIRSNMVLSSNNDGRCPMCSLIYSIMQLLFFQCVIKAFSLIPRFISLSLFSIIILWRSNPGGYSTLVWVGVCPLGILKRHHPSPIHVPILKEKWPIHVPWYMRSGPSMYHSVQFLTTHTCICWKKFTHEGTRIKLIITT